jgi:hypothetical protein
VVYSKTGELRFDDLCMEGSKNNVVKLQKCADGNQKQIWNYNNEVNSFRFFIKDYFLFSDKTNETCLFWSMYDCRSE